jgi:hypothetical protein
MVASSPISENIYPQNVENLPQKKSWVLQGKFFEAYIYLYG